MTANGKTEVVLRRTPFQEVEDLLSARWPFDVRFPRLERLFREPGLAPIDMFEKDGKVVIKAEMPGIEPEKVEITIVGNELRVSGERTDEKEVREENYYRSERTFGRVFRTITLPEGVDGEAVKATMKDGVLTIEVERKEAVTPKKITVTKS